MGSEMCIRDRESLNPSDFRDPMKIGSSFQTPTTFRPNINSAILEENTLQNNNNNQKRPLLNKGQRVLGLNELQKLLNANINSGEFKEPNSGKWNETLRLKLTKQGSSRHWSTF